MNEKGKLLGIDYGRARIGIAVSDPLGISTSPIGFIPRESDKKAVLLVLALAQQHEVRGIVIGLPLHVSGDVGESARWVRSFIALIQSQSPLPIYEMDERYSSAEAEESLRNEGKWPVDPGVLDAKSAAVILRRYLDGEQNIS